MNEKEKAYTKEYRSRPEVKERIKKWRENNKEHLIKKAKEWREKNRESKNKEDKEYYHKKRCDPEFVKKEIKRQRKFREEKKENVLNHKQKYYNSKKGKLNYFYHNHRRLSLIKNSKTNLTNEKVKQLFERDKVCVYCGSDKKLEMDHIIPLKSGGSCMYNNFVIACAKCNRSKSGRDVFYWCKLKKIEVPKIVLELLKKQGIRK